MAEKKPSGFRFRLPWLLQPALAPRPAVAPGTPTQPPRTTTQTSVAPPSAQRPPFRPPGKAPAPPASPVRSKVSVASSPPSAPAKSPESAIAKTPDPVAMETIPTGETSNLTNPPEVSKTDLETQTIKETQPTTENLEATKTSSPKSPPAVVKFVNTVETQPTQEIRRTDETIAATTEAPRPTTPPQRPPSPHKAPSPPKSKSQPPFPSRAETQLQVSSDPASPSRPQTNSPPPSPSHMAAQSHVQTKSSSPSLGVTQTQATSQTGTPPRPPSRSTSPPTNKTGTPPRPSSRPTSPPTDKTGTPPRPSSRPTSPPTDKTASPPTTTTSPVQRHEVSVNQNVQLPSLTPKSDDTPEIERSTELPDLSLDLKPKEITKVKGAQTNSANPYSMDKIQETKSHKTKPTIAARVPLHREIKDDISKFIHNIATSPTKQYMDEKPASVITVAGDNIGASMDLHSDASKREGAINGRKSETDSNTNENEEVRAIINSNVQGINNSMMLNTSVKERNPGVHVVFSRDIANTNGSKIKKTKSMDMHKEEADVTPPQTIVYDPTIGSSRVGAFMDPKDSDPDDHEMSAKDYEIDVL